MSTTAADLHWPEDLENRLKVLLHVHPFTKLKRSDSHRGDHYDTMALALWVLDQVIENTGLTEEMNRERLRARAEPLLTAMDEQAGVEPDPALHADIVEGVLEALLNKSEGYQAFRGTYPQAEERDMKEATYEFRLLREDFDDNGDVVLRLSPTAVNVFFGLINPDMDIEDAQAATEALVENQLRRGKFDEAVASARTARHQSRQYRQTIVDILKRTRRSIQTVDWSRGGDVAGIIDAAKEHLKARQAVETRLIETAEERIRDLDPLSEDARNVSTVLGEINKVRDTHFDLFSHLQGATQTFLDEQARQAFQPQRRGLLPDIELDVLRPFLEAPAGNVRERTTAVLSEVTGPRVPSLIHLLRVIEWNLRKRPTPRPDAVSVERAELAHVVRDRQRYPLEVRKVGDAYLEDLTSTVLLSDLLATVEREGEPQTVLEYIAFRALQQYGPDSKDGPRLVDVARTNGRRYAHGSFSGDDLVIAPLPESGE